MLKIMKVLIIGRGTLFTRPGGDTIQMTKTAEFLNMINNVEVDVKTIDDNVDFHKYDFLHLFNIGRPSDMLGVLKKTNQPYLISTVFVDFSEAEANHYKKPRRLLSKLLSADQLEFIKILARFLKGQEKILDYKYFLLGQKKSIKKLIKESHSLLPNSKSEYSRLYKKYGIKKKYFVIPNAIDKTIFDSNHAFEAEYSKFQDAVISIGQITPVKNQLSLIKALNKTKYKVYIIGSPSMNAIDYYEECKKTASDNINFLSRVDQNQLAQIYKAARVHVLCSWFETTGLVSLEAAYMECNIVITKKGDQEEYFRNQAFYCDPDDVNSILQAVNEAYNSDYNKELKERIAKNYSWEITASKTLEAYNDLLSKNLNN
jgi:glycosyltransferase involved in cell wall biosynthesis